MNSITLTSKLLKECKKVGYTYIYIGQQPLCDVIKDEYTRKIFKDTNLHGIVAAHQMDNYDNSPKIGHDPALWGICRMIGIPYGCANGHQVFPEYSFLMKHLLIDGVYILDSVEEIIQELIIKELRGKETVV